MRETNVITYRAFFLTNNGPPHALMERLRKLLYHRNFGDHNLVDLNTSR